MKKIILIFIFILQLLPGQLQNGNVELTAGTSLYAQCAGAGAGSPCGSSGGSFWIWLNTAFTNVGNFFTSIGHAISNFVNNVPGGNTQMPEGMTTENQGWAWTDDGWLPNDGNDSGGPYDPWADSYWQSLGLSPDEMNILQNWQYYYDVYQQGGNPPPPPPGRYYVKVFFNAANLDTGNAPSPDTTKYYEGDTIYLMQRTTPASLVIYRENGTVSTTAIAWKRNDTSKCTGIISCDYNISNVGIIQEKVDSANSKLLTKNPLAIYKKPTLYFRTGNDYKGEYGFDDSAHKYFNIRNNPIFSYGYQVKQINDDTAYYVPWLSVIDDQRTTVLDSIKSLSLHAKKDKNAYVQLVTDENVNILINNTTSPKFYFSSLDVINSLSITVKQWTTKLDSLRQNGDYNLLFKKVHAITHTGDTIGEINFSCSKPETKQIVFVYVNTGHGYDSSILTKVKMLNQLNKNSHNQLMRQWVQNTSYSDTLDLSAEYTGAPGNFIEANMPEIFKDFYKLHKGVDIVAINRYSGGARDSSYIRFAFISTLTMQRDTIINAIPTTMFTHGITAANFGSYAALFHTADLKVVSHEFGHMLKQDHTWEQPFLVPGKTTLNYMDYAPNGVTRNFNKFWYGQWIITF